MRVGQPHLGVMLFGFDGRADYLELHAPERPDGDPALPLPSASEITG